MHLITQVRRQDFNLRAKYPDLNTVIVQCTPGDFVIYCPGNPSDFTAIAADFQQAICPVTLLSAIALSQQMPDHYLQLIPGLADEDIAKNFAGISLTAGTLLNLLLAKFPAVPFHEVKQVDAVIQVVTTTYEERREDTTRLHYLTAADKQRVTHFLQGLDLGLPCELVEIPNLGSDAKPLLADSNPVRFIYAANIHRSQATPYELRDEALWYDSLNQVFAGDFRKDNLYFFDNQAYSCYVDYTYGNIDLRNHLLLFERVYLTPPYGDYGRRNLTQWLHGLKISKEEFLQLVASGRVYLILNQPIYRYDQRFIDEVYEVRTEAVITRRALATLLQIDLVELADNYLLNDTRLLPELRALSSLLGDKLQLDAAYLYESLNWPIRARRQSFEALNANGIYSTAAFGVNTFLGSFVKRATGRDLELEFSASAANIHLASALNATYFPYAMPEGGFSDHVFAALMGETLNFYKSATTSQLKSLLDNQQLLASGVRPIDPIELFDIDSYLSIEESEHILQWDAAHTGSKRLMETLAALTPEQRVRKIAYYNQRVKEKRASKQAASWQLDLGVNIALDGAAWLTGGQGLGSLYWVLRKATGVASRLPLVKHTLAAFEQAIYNPSVDRRNINYLTQINRVARLKRFP